MRRGLKCNLFDLALLFSQLLLGDDFMAGNTHVPDKLEGYLLQVRHALFELISLDDRIVSVESYDDVAVETEGLVIAEQTKSALSKNNPSANRAVVFWKTLKNWCEYIRDGELPNKPFVLKYIVVSTEQLSVGDIPQSFSDAESEEEAKEAFEAVRPNYVADDQTVKLVSEELKPYIDFCFDDKNKALMCTVIANMKIEVHSGTYDDELISKFAKQTIPEEYTDVLFISMLGWVHEKVHKQTKQNRPAFISSVDYRKELLAQIKSRDQKVILSAVSSKPSDEATASEVDRRDKYIKQLDLIDSDMADLLEAASDYLRTRCEKTEWAARGIVTQSSMNDYNDSLSRNWKSLKRILEISHSTDAIAQGQTLYAQCKLSAAPVKLQGAETPSFFGSGSLHILANEPPECPQIGWHPNYAELLKEDDKNNGES